MFYKAKLSEKIFKNTNRIFDSILISISLKAN